MATRIRTLNFLPEIFKTTTNSQFLNATLDQIVDQPNTKRIEGYIGSRFGYGVNAKNYYVTEVIPKIYTFKKNQSKKAQ